MRITIIAAALIASIGAASAGQHNNAVSSSHSWSNSQSYSSSNSQANNAGNNQSTTFQDRRQAPGIAAPGLTNGANVCVGSVSGGISFPGGGVLFGTTTEDKPCNLRENAKLLWALGARKSAIELMRTDPLIGEALQRGRNR